MRATKKLLLITEPGRRPVLARSLHRESCFFSAIADRVQRSERYVVGQYGGLRFDACSHPSLREALRAPRFGARLAPVWLLLSQWCAVWRLSRRARPAVLHLRVRSGTRGVEEERDHFEEPGFARISSHHGERAVLQRDGCKWLTAATHSYFLFWQRTSRRSTVCHKAN